MTLAQRGDVASTAAPEAGLGARVWICQRYRAPVAQPLFGMLLMNYDALPPL